jgi:uncharacterized protein (DUF433 family)
MNGTITPPKIVSDPKILGGMLCIEGTRVPAETIRQYLIGGYDWAEIYTDYPTLPRGGIEAVLEWSKQNGLEC